MRPGSQDYPVQTAIDHTRRAFVDISAIRYLCGVLRREPFRSNAIEERWLRLNWAFPIEIFDCYKEES